MDMSEFIVRMKQHFQQRGFVLGVEYPEPECFEMFLSADDGFGSVHGSIRFSKNVTESVAGSDLYDADLKIEASLSWFEGDSLIDDSVSYSAQGLPLSEPTMAVILIKMDEGWAKLSESFSCRLSQMESDLANFKSGLEFINSKIK